MTPALEVIHGGLLTTVQDLGRPGHMHEGLSPGGAMDRYMLQCANALVGNPPGAAALEFTLDGPVLAVRGEVVAAMVAIQAEWFVGGPEHPLPAWEGLLVQDGSVLVVGAVRRGVRGYLAVAGGIDVPPVMGSRSTHLRARLGGVAGRAILPGDVLPIGRPELDCEALVGRRIPPALRPSHFGGPIRVMAGPQQDHFTTRGLRRFFHQAFRVSARSDRMGVRLEGAPVERARGREMTSEPAAAGSIQVPGDGRPVILLAERPSIGGYRKIATVIGADLDAAGQLRPGERARFFPVDEATARRAMAERQARLARVMAWLQGSRDPAGGGEGEDRPPGAGRFMVSSGGTVYYVEREAG